MKNVRTVIYKIPLFLLAALALFQCHLFAKPPNGDPPDLEFLTALEEDYLLSLNSPMEILLDQLDPDLGALNKVTISMAIEDHAAFYNVTFFNDSEEPVNDVTVACTFTVSLKRIKSPVDELLLAEYEHEQSGIAALAANGYYQLGGILEGETVEPSADSELDSWGFIGPSTVPLEIAYRLQTSSPPPLEFAAFNADQCSVHLKIAYGYISLKEGMS